MNLFFCFSASHDRSISRCASLWLGCINAQTTDWWQLILLRLPGDEEMRDWTQIRAGPCHCDPISSSNVSRRRLCFTSNGPLLITRNHLVHVKTNAKTESMTFHNNVTWLHWLSNFLQLRFNHESQVCTWVSERLREYCGSDLQFD